MQKIFLMTLLYCLHISAQTLVSPAEVMTLTFGNDAKITQKNILLTQEDSQALQTQAQAKIETKIFKVFEATHEDRSLGYGILVSQKVRTKNAVALYCISQEGILKTIEIIAFNEPNEYLPSKEWKKRFENVSTDAMLHSGKEIPTITGATLSARALSDGSRIAFALYKQLLKKQS